MEPFKTAELAMERWTATLWGILFRPKRRPGDVVAVLRRECDDNALIVARQRVVVPNVFVIDLLPDTHRKLTTHALPVEPHLVNQVRRHAAEQGYTFAGPVAVDLRPAHRETTERFRVRSRIAPVERRPRPTGFQERR
ncbi:FhaA domain-containing protein [Streptomyces sp. NPDC048156]|uniref:FhaA domain-containing protein n=1 Tax=Streptomyces sp. NPDC048156 TaxID=3365502 RepID=UPI00370FF798